METQNLINMFTLKTGLNFSELKKQSEEFIVNKYGMPVFFCSEDLKLILMMQEENLDSYLWSEEDIEEQIENFKNSLSEI